MRKGRKGNFSISDQKLIRCVFIWGLDLDWSSLSDAAQSEGWDLLGRERHLMDRLGPGSRVVDFSLRELPTGYFHRTTKGRSVITIFSW